jgi:hypothetical protein
VWLSRCECAGLSCVWMGPSCPMQLRDPGSGCYRADPVRWGLRQRLACGWEVAREWEHHWARVWLTVDRLSLKAEWSRGAVPSRNVRPILPFRRDPEPAFAVGVGADCGVGRREQCVALDERVASAGRSCSAASRSGSPA